ncbi:MAG: VWA domain-containing protein [Rhodobacter sp.]|nr:VWA domain-containing protein [Rhodobacter sp.]
MSRLLLALCLFCAAALTLSVPRADAQDTTPDRSRAILVLDGSGSMWGQIDGVAKITIAQDVIDGLLQTLPGEQDLGLTVYGHRRKGDCSDIETIIQPGGDQRAAISAAVNAIKPKGKTPLSAAVIAAAEALKYTEERATVILVSDGRETCDFDPCEVGRKLEAAGIDFTAHVIGFDVNDPADRAQLQCLAEETGGTFRTASNAGELAEALLVVAEPPAPEPVAPAEFDVTFLAKADGINISSGLVWTIRDAAGQVLLEGGSDMTPTLKMTAGDYSAQVLRSADGASAARDFPVGNTHQTVILNLPGLPPQPVRVHARATDGRNGPVINDDLIWDVTDGAGNNVVDTEIAPGLDLQLVKGEYTVSVLRPVDEAFAEQRFGVGSVDKRIVLELPEYRPLATLEAPATAVAGSDLQVRWTGPDAKNDFVSVAEPAAEGARWINYTYTRQGPLLTVQMPPRPGTYELRYILADGRKILGTHPITVTAVAASVTPPADLPAGASVAVDWQGPDYKNDFLAVTRPGEDKWINYTYTRQGTPLTLQMPPEPGDYDVIYVMDQDRTILVRVPVKVTGIDFAVGGPETAAAGSTIAVDWVGPDYKNDFIAVAEVGAPNTKWLKYTYTREGTPVQLALPLTPGSYELRYVLGQDRVIKARAPLQVTPVTGGISAPDAADAGARIEVNWKGPGYRNDFVSVASPDQPVTKYHHYTYTREGTPLLLEMPVDPGTYELRYVAAGSDAMVLARQPITVNPISATLTAEASAAPGSNLAVTWQGPDYRNDYVAISRADDPKGYEVFAYTREGSPMVLKVPAAPGAYELRYVLGQGRRILQRVPLTVQ